MIDYATTERLQFISEVFKDEGAAWRLEAKRARARIKLLEIKKRHPEWIVKRLEKKMNNQQQQEERQQKILEALEDLKTSCIAAKQYHRNSSAFKNDLEHLDFLASECGVSEQWRKRNGD